MQQRLVIGMGVLVLGLLAWNSWTLSQLDARMTELEEGLSPDGAMRSDAGDTTVSPSSDETDAMTVRSESSRSEDRPRGESRSNAVDSRSEGGGSVLNLDDPAVRNALADYLEEYEIDRKEERREEGLAQYLDYVSSETEAFCEEYGVDEATMGQVITEIETRTHEWVEVEHAAKDGEMDRSEAKAEMEAIEELGQANLRALLGNELYELFEERIWKDG